MASLKIVISVLITLLIVLFTFSEAREFVVGGHKYSWSYPTSSHSLNLWARKERFEVGDALIFVYNQTIDAVLEVTKDDYDKCNVSNPINEYRDGNTTVELDRSGPFYFISKDVVSCEKGQKLTVAVLHKHPKPPLPPGHAPSPAPTPKGHASSPAPLSPSPKVPPPSPAPTPKGHASSPAPLSPSPKVPPPSPAPTPKGHASSPAPLSHSPKVPPPSPAPLAPPPLPTSGVVFGLRGGFVGIVVGIMSLVGIYGFI